jgi:ferric-dicitrate binding protein FerR (iron transport regulator)
MGPDSGLRWEARDRLRLEAGAVYVDSGRGAGGPSSFEVQTPRGTVRETGTQFEVRLEPAALRVRVREGRVAVLGPGPTLDVASGTELRVGDGGARRRAVAVYGPEWAWVLGLAPAYEIEGRPLHGFLAWAAREAGWQLRYADAASQRRSESARLHGSIRGMSPDEAVTTVAPSTGLACRLHEGVLRVGPADAAGVE